jgi:hypothetical protein
MFRMKRHEMTLKDSTEQHPSTAQPAQSPSLQKRISPLQNAHPQPVIPQACHQQDRDHLLPYQINIRISTSVRWETHTALY